MTIIEKAFPPSTKSKSGKPRKKYRFAVTYHDVYGNSKRYYSKWFDKKSDCVNAEAEYRRNPIPSKSGVTFNTAAIGYLKSIEKQIAKSTYKEKVRIFDSRFKELKNKRIDTITSLYIIDLFEPYKDLSAKTLNKYYDTLNGAFEYAITYYGLKENPMRRIPRFKGSRTLKKEKICIYTPDQFLSFYNAISDEYEEVKTFFHLLYWTGLRKNEAMSLTWKDVKGNTLNIYRQWINGEWEVLKTGKSVREVTIDDKTLELLNELKAKQKKNKRFKESWFVFGGATQLSESIIRSEKKKAAEKAGLPYIRTHDLRHSHVSYLISENVNMYLISRRLGHASINMTMDIYGHLLPQSQDEIINIINQRNK